VQRCTRRRAEIAARDAPCARARLPVRVFELIGRTACGSCVNTLWGSDRVLRTGQFLGRFIAGSPEVRPHHRRPPQQLRTRHADLLRANSLLNAYLSHFRAGNQQRTVGCESFRPARAHALSGAGTFVCTPSHVRGVSGSRAYVIRRGVPSDVSFGRVGIFPHLSNLAVVWQFGSEANAVGLIFGAGTLNKTLN
jgi:hypothetical protein